MAPAYVAGMVTRIHKGYRGRLFLKEHRKAKGVSAEAMGGRLGIERESVYRLERNPGTITDQKLCIYAEALDIEPEELRKPPGVRSLDAMVKKAPQDVQMMAADIVWRLVSGGKA
jgi:transcriptional regulator with XRE-family HTH domain